MDIDFYQHLVLATWLFLIVYRWLHKKYTFMAVMGVAIIYEVITYFIEYENYSGWNHYAKDTLLDLGAALTSCFVCTVILKDKK